MTLQANSMFGHYHIGAVIGEGGMGQVYLATDTTLDREVAIKVLPDSFAEDADRIARFGREAKTLASLNHPNIGMIFGLEKEGGITALVMELIEGPTLEDRIKQGPIPPEEALRIAKQLIDGLEAAHERGIVHRDLKPANIKVKDNGQVKILDFGIARPIEVQGSSGGHTPTMITPAVTESGVIMGTAAYMSPEQARGRFVDERTDIWAFGCVLYEMLTGQPAFGGEDVAETLARIITLEADTGSLTGVISPAVNKTIALCLQKDVRKRIADIRDVKLALQGAFETTDSSLAGNEASEVRRGPWRLALAAALSGLVGAILVWSLVPRDTEHALPTRFIVRTADDMPLSTNIPALALSPNGRDLVYAVAPGSGQVEEQGSRFYHQSLDDFAAQVIDGSLGGRLPAFLPDGDRISFVENATNQVQQLELAGGRSTRLSEGRVGPYSSLAADGSIVFQIRWGAPLGIIRPGETEAGELTRLDVEAGEASHLVPQILPGDRSVLFTVWSGEPSWDDAQLAVADLQTGEHSIVLNGGTAGRYAESGHLVFWRGNALMAAPFDIDTLTVTGTAVRVVRDVRLSLANGTADFAISSDGSLAYVAGGEDAFTESFIVDRTGQEIARLDDKAAAGDPVFSPDGRQVALTLYRGGAFGVGIYDLDRAQMQPLVISGGDNAFPAWMPDGESLSFTSSADGEYSLYKVRADGSSAPVPIFPEPKGYSDQMFWSADGRYLLYMTGGNQNADVWVYEPAAETDPRPLLATPANEGSAVLSPDGHYILYRSNESGLNEVYVRPFPAVETRRIQVSQGGGRAPRWSRDGSEIFYAANAGLMRVPVVSTGEGSLSFGQSSLLFEMSFITNFDVSPDGQNFAIDRLPIEKAPKEIHVVTNWFEELRQLVPAQ